MEVKVYVDGKYLGEADVELPPMIGSASLSSSSDLDSKNCAVLIATELASRTIPFKRA
jgi:hypothetical protein